MSATLGHSSRTDQLWKYVCVTVFPLYSVYSVSPVFPYSAKNENRLLRGRLITQPEAGWARRAGVAPRSGASDRVYCAARPDTLAGTPGTGVPSGCRLPSAAMVNARIVFPLVSST